MAALGRCCRGLRQLCTRAADSTALPSASCGRMLLSVSNVRRDVSVQARQGLATRAVATKDDTGVDAMVANKARWPGLGAPPAKTVPHWLITKSHCPACRPKRMACNGSKKCL